MTQKFVSKLFLSIIVIIAVTTMGMAGNWILDSKSGKLPADLEALVKKAGGTLVSSLDDVGVATAEFATREEAEAMEAYGFTVMPDVELNWVPSKENYLSATAEHIGQNEPYYKYQWHLPAIQADKAWDEGYTGAGVRIAVVDSGIWYLHPDLASRIDHASSATFVPGTTDYIDQDGHGTHVAGIIAASANNSGVMGVAPNATLIAVRVLGPTGSGSISAILKGVVHAVEVDADIINMSLGSYITKSGVDGAYTANDAAYIHSTYRRVLNWAKEQGALVVTSAGNSAIDLDHNRNEIKLPAEAVNGMVISATAPHQLQNFDMPTSYTNYGKSVITVAAPGGDYKAGGSIFDLMLSTAPGGYMFAAGTSQATPVVSGIAALVLEKYGPMSPEELKNHIKNTADDLGKKGKDAYYGQGRVNAYKAVTR